MPKPILSVRATGALIAAIDAAATRAGRSRSDEVLAALAERYLGHDAQPLPAPKAPPRPKAPVAADPREALAQAEARTGVAPARVAARLDTSMVEVFHGAKRPAYQKGGQGAGKARR